MVRRIFWSLFPKRINDEDDFIRLFRSGGYVLETKRWCRCHAAEGAFKYIVTGRIDFTGIKAGERPIRFSRIIHEECDMNPDSVRDIQKEVNGTLVRERTSLEEKLYYVEE